MNIVEIRRPEEIEDLRAAWDALVSVSTSKTIFVTWEWLTTWWSSYGSASGIRVLLAYDDAGVLRGIAPLRERRVSRYGQTARALSFIGDGSNDSDYLDLVIAPGYEKQTMEAFGQRWTAALNGGAVLQLNDIPVRSPNLAFLKDLARTTGSLWNETRTPCSTVRLPESWDGYLGSLKPRFRTKVRSVLRELEGRPGIRFQFCKTAAEVEWLLPILFDLHTRRWAQEGQAGVFGWPEKRSFYERLSSRLLEQGWLRFSWLEWNGRVLACQYGLGYASVYFQLQEGYQPASRHCNVGLGLRAWSIRELQNEGIREYDFLGGASQNKTDWGSEIKYSSRVEILQPSLRNVLFRRGPELEEGAREFIRKHAPQKLLSARAAYHSKRSLVASPDFSVEGTQKVEMGLTQRTVASLYYHLGLTKLTRPVRDRYQASVQHAGRLPRLMWNRRRQPAARILYYHRINDDGDPFYPATTTGVFEQHMRYVAGRYKVVSLGQLLGHLEHGSTETVLAITFDDGYQDNYQNAFPILRRYNLPATIFLTTGGLDSREPLWFEHLAEALKKSSREFVDVEIDIPRRLWTRSQVERLNCVQSIYEILRQLPESDRQEWLKRIIRQLGVSTIKERWDKMLTWDQVRLMKTQGITFGGHTVTHPFLSQMSRDQVAWEAAECKRRIQEELQQQVDFFAYPSGRESDFGMWNKDVIRSAGYRAAMTTIWGVNYTSTDPMEMRRGGPWETNISQFAYKLDWYHFTNG